MDKPAASLSGATRRARPALVIEAEADTPRPIVPIPLRPTKVQQTVSDTSAAAETVAPEAPDEASGPAGPESAASS